MARISLWQRDLGHVNDRDRLPRIHALDHLNRSLISTPISTAASDLRIRFIADHLTKVFVEKLVNDPVERCRDLCLSIIVGLIQKLGTRDNCRLAHNLIPIISFRFGNTPEKEPVEELRLRSDISCDANICSARIEFRLIETCSAILSRTALENWECIHHSFCPKFYNVSSAGYDRHVPTRKKSCAVWDLWPVSCCSSENWSVL
jgi:hypothetical protein